MSIKLMAQVWEADLPSSEKFVLLALADHARDDGSRVYPSIRTVALKTGFSERTVQRQVRELLKRGILTVVKKSVRYGTTEYFIRGDKLSPLPPLRGDTVSSQGCQPVMSGVTNTTFRGDTVSPEPSVNHQKNHKRKSTNKNPFVRPSLAEVQEYCQERQNRIDPSRFLDYYTSTGWRVGRNPMKDWRAAVRTWEQRDKEKPNARRKDSSRIQSEPGKYDGLPVHVFDNSPQ